MRWLLSHGPAVIALGAVALYTLGVIGSIGQLRASHVDVSAGFSLIPLERHLRVGVATLLSGEVLIALAMFALLLVHTTGVQKLDAWARDPESHAEGLRAYVDRATSRQISRLPATVAGPRSSVHLL